MIIKWPGCKKGQVDNGLHYNLDLLPTLAEFGMDKVMLQLYLKEKIVNLNVNAK